MDTAPSTSSVLVARLQTADAPVVKLASRSGGDLTNIASPVKRGRGRPKKNPEGSVMAHGTSVSQKEREAPTKVPLVDPPAVPMSVESRALGASVGGTPGAVDSGKPHSAEEMVSTVGKLAEQVAIVNTLGGSLPVKRKRGRPRKEESRMVSRKNPLADDNGSKAMPAPSVSATNPVSSSSTAPPSSEGTELSENLDISPSAKRPRVAQETEIEPPHIAISSQQPAVLKQHCSDELMPEPPVEPSEPPAKRGRPRTHQPQPEGTKPKRGRPRKHPLPPELPDGQPVVKRKRGRPRKNPLPPEGPPIVKRKRGRPRKNPLPESDPEAVDKESEAQPKAIVSSEQLVMHEKGGEPQKTGPEQQQPVIGTPVKRGRGRPRKHPLPVVKNGSATSASSPLKKRGRPKKNPQEQLYTKRGRPRENIPMVTVVAETTETSEVNVDTIEGSENVPLLPKGRFHLEVSFSESDSEGELEMGREAIKALADRVVEGSPRVKIDPDFEESFDESSST